jgi:hypothetical protein
MSTVSTERPTNRERKMSLVRSRNKSLIAEAVIFKA